MMKIINDTYKDSVRYVVAQTEGVCSQAIELLVEGVVILDAAFHGGCNGNLKGIVALCKGQKLSEVQQRLTGKPVAAKVLHVRISLHNCSSLSPVDFKTFM